VPASPTDPIYRPFGLKQILDIKIDVCARIFNVGRSGNEREESIKVGKEVVLLLSLNSIFRF
jgi:hypothetical protein